MKIVLVLALALGGCAAPKATATAGAPPPTMQPMPGDRHAEITELSQKIDTARDQMGLPPAAPLEPHTQMHAQAMAIPPHAADDNACHHAPSDACTQSCSLSDDICDNAKRICDLAQQLAGDSWAEDKCRTADSTCNAAHERCCSCS